jgi:hypothetical protein
VGNSGIRRANRFGEVLDEIVETEAETGFEAALRPIPWRSGAFLPARGPVFDYETSQSKPLQSDTRGDFCETGAKRKFILAETTQHEFGLHPREIVLLRLYI